MFSLPLADWLSFNLFKMDNPLVVVGLAIAVVVLGYLAFTGGKKKEGDDPVAEDAPKPTPIKPGDLQESLDRLAKVINFVGIPEGAVILSDLAAGDYSNAPRAARQLATRLDTPDGRRELIRRVIEKHASTFADDPQLVSKFASTLRKSTKV